MFVDVSRCDDVVILEDKHQILLGRGPVIGEGAENGVFRRVRR